MYKEWWKKKEILIQYKNEFVQLIQNKYPEESDLILRDFLTHFYKISSDDSVNELVTNYNVMISAYEESPNFRVKKQILSLIPEKYSRITIMKAFGISQWLVDSARKHSKQAGAGMIVQSDPRSIEKGLIQ